MTVGRRLARVEGSLAPRQIVLRVLAEAQQFDSLEAYTRSFLALPEEEAPLGRIATEVEAAVRLSMKGEARETVEASVRRAVGDGLFAFLLVLQLNAATFEVARLEGLRAAGLFYWMGSLLGGPRSADLDEAERVEHERELAAAWRNWTTVLEDLVELVAIEEEARSVLESRYLDGHTALLADAAAAWTSFRNMVDRMSSIASDLVPAKPTGSVRAPRDCANVLRGPRSAPGHSPMTRGSRRSTSSASDAGRWRSWSVGWVVKVEPRREATRRQSEFVLPRGYPHS